MQKLSRARVFQFLYFFMKPFTRRAGRGDFEEICCKADGSGTNTLLCRCKFRLRLVFIQKLSSARHFPVVWNAQSSPREINNASQSTVPKWNSAGSFTPDTFTQQKQDKDGGVKENIARGTTNPGIASITWIRYKFSHQMVAPSGG